MERRNKPTIITTTPVYPITIEEGSHSLSEPLKYEPTGIPIAIRDPLIPIILP
ncbi:hypothetical protein AAC03nite_27420 [Alicyclobacillus acidoterrestris]|nr:hypothetical protein AAC03nite_27420 [Alicyclobacillus acidoterrestris]